MNQVSKVREITCKVGGMFSVFRLRNLARCAERGYLTALEVHPGSETVSVLTVCGLLDDCVHFVGCASEWCSVGEAETGLVETNLSRPGSLRRGCAFLVAIQMALVSPAQHPVEADEQLVGPWPPWRWTSPPLDQSPVDVFELRVVTNGQSGFDRGQRLRTGATFIKEL